MLFPPSQSILSKSWTSIFSMNFIFFELFFLNKFITGWISSNDVVVKDLDIKFSVKEWVYFNTKHTY